MIESVLTALFLVGGLGQPSGPSAGGPPDAGSKPVPPMQLKDPITISADRFEILGKSQQAVWTGHVCARSDTLILSCERLIAHYTKNQEIAKIECVGGVEAASQDKWAKGERAEFDNASRVLVVTGSPEAMQGPNHMRGTRVIFYLEKNLIHVENATIVIKKPGVDVGPKNPCARTRPGLGARGPGPGGADGGSAP